MAAAAAGPAALALALSAAPAAAELFAAAANLSPDQCFQLAGSAVCPDLTAYYIMPSTEFNSVASFDSYVMGQQDNTTSFVSKFRSAFDCPGFAGHTIRFEQSILCYFMVASSLPSCPPPSPAPTNAAGQNATAAPMLCKSSCTSYVNSVKNTFSNATICNANPSTTAAANRQNVVGTGGNIITYADFCATQTVDDTSMCSLGVKADVLRCGFANSTDAAPYCSANSSDPCCGAIAAASAPTDAYSALLASPNRVWIISGIVAGALVGLFVLYYIATRVTRMVAGTTTAFQPPPEDRPRFGTIARSGDPESGRRKSGPGGRLSIFSNIRASIMGTKQPRGNKFTPQDAPPLPNSTVSMSMATPISMPRAPPVPIAPSASAFAGRDSIFAPAAALANRMPPAAAARPPSMAQTMQTGQPSMLESVAVVPGPGERCVQAVEDYDRAMEDEIELRVGDVIIVLQEFDDGWAFGRNTVTGAEGVFPMTITEHYEIGQKINREYNGRQSVLTARTKSLQAR
ncbi:hypothetical protein HK105_206721 [Polyrhizophydium stewartii]|uniref:SH3 domain-containing protein n=1 Tax=Polyrhizophydium stewartii TaxID=2732419 RepID=A0ABR4N2H6_9FUNG